MRLRITYVLFFICAMLTSIASVSATLPSQKVGIAVVVNDGAISYMDIQSRLALIIASSGLPDNNQTRQKLLPQVVNMLIEEAVQMQEAERLDILVTEQEIDAGFNDLAKTNNMTSQQFEQLLEGKNVPVISLRKQIKARLAWQKVFSSDLRRNVRVSNSDIESQLQRMQDHIGQTEYLLSEIFLPVDTVTDDKAVKKLAQQVVTDISNKRAPFAAVAQQISKAPGAQTGGALGWVPENQLEPEVRSVVSTMASKSLTHPIRTLDGYHIFYLSDKRTITADKIPSRDEVANMLTMDRAERISRNRLNALKHGAFIDNRIEMR
ncbi:MAG: rotamase [Alphaproteobacteria bacterium]|nr:rotamase [Alphaproteobacteria bacterium]HCQ71355.1 rotamase [Rhodospirillaceae bacterium]|tara:strand:- start:24200 stop:25165 length:966 start_codon:yes stop_codon:yes gene_type:complete